MIYLIHVLNIICLFSVVAIGTNLIVGFGGSVSLAQAGLFGIGAYASTLGVMKLGVPFGVGLTLGAASSALVALLVALMALRLSEDYFVVATLGVQYVTWTIMNNWQEVTNGPFGLTGIPFPTLFGFPFSSPGRYVFLTVVAAGLCFVLVRALTVAPWGRVLTAIREDDLFAQSLGKNTLDFRAAAFMVSGATAGAAGALYAPFLAFIDPTSFTISESVLILAMVIIGGPGSLWGPVIGAALLVALPELLRFVGLPEAVSANLRQIIFGSLLVLTILFRPKGIAGRYEFGRR